MALKIATKTGTRDATSSEESEILADRKKWNDGASARRAIKNRGKRNDLLSATDFYALSDVTLSDEMKTYRQALRDLPTHSDWPNLADSDWPTKPS